MDAQNGSVQQDGLSKRAVEILRLLADGLSDREVAETLVMTINTVKWYNRQIYSILGVKSRTQAIARARELQLLGAGFEGSDAFEAPVRWEKANLPVETNRFIGRQQDIERITQLLDQSRLLTLVGAPGTGKTRLALQVAWGQVDTFDDGVYFVSLAPVSEPRFVTEAIAHAVGLTEAKGRSLLDTLKQTLRDRHVLLVLDNFEHVLPAAAAVSELLAAASYLKVLATSREPLHLYGEQEYSVPSLPMPPSDSVDFQTLMTVEAVALFVQRAQAVRPSFALTAENAADVAQICIRLDGLPLAIELAAARIKLLTPQLLLTRLDNRLATLRGGATDLPPRQQTLYDTIDWSFNLLSEDEKQLFALLSVFRGGCSFDAAEALCGDQLRIDVFEGLSSLVDKSLLHYSELPNGEPHFAMLETLHEYAWAQLWACGDAPASQARHAAYFTRFAVQAAPELRQAGFTTWMTRLENEENNLYAALEWAFGPGDPALGVQLVSALRDFWIMSNHLTQALTWVERALSYTSQVSNELRVSLLTTMGMVLHYAADQRPLQRQILEEAADLARRTGGDRQNLGWALVFAGAAALGRRDDYEDGMTLVDEGMQLFRDMGYKPGIVQALNTMGEIMRIYGDIDGAQTVYEECLLLARETGEARREAMMLNNIGSLMMHRQDAGRAKQLFRNALIQRMKVGYDRRGCLTNILFLAGAIGMTGNPARAATLFGAVHALLEPMGIRLEHGDQPEYARDLAAVKAQLDPAVFQACWLAGQGFTLEQAAAYALDDAANSLN